LLQKAKVAIEKMADTVTDHLTADKQPCETATDEPLDYSSLQVICKVCDGIAVFEDYERRYQYPADTCKCPHIVLDEFNVSPEVAAIYRGVHAIRAAQKQGHGPASDSFPDEVRKELVKHRKALALISSFATFGDAGFFGVQPARAIQSLIGSVACKECVGTGWVARDESCKHCHASGYIEA